MRVVLGVMVFFAALPAVSSASPVTVAFHPTGGEQAFLVPGGVRSVHVVAVGAHGGLGYRPAMGTSGGLGALVSGDVPVVPGTTLFVEVGGNGTDAVGYSHPTGGFNGGGTGGYGASYSGGAGGGASDVRIAPAAQA